jgi:aminoglycoside/choline kinase family phosphotransferase
MTRLVSQTPDTPFLRSDREDERLSSLKTWLVSDLDMQITSLTPASEDASFRRYFRALTPSGQSWIVMDAPPEKEDCRPFLAISMILRNIGVTAPQVYELDLDRGFLLLDDFGHRPYLGALNADSAEPLYRDAMNALCQIQTQGSTDDSFIPA